ncbi:hypothetical protein EDB86DRAFT_3082906 [Lactarius hatsudake]|nr:hypothetical protein EDB86DRAFT_3082906 [Lactarius hatsudake]
MSSADTGLQAMALILDLPSYYFDLNVIITVIVNVLDHRFPSPVPRIVHNFTRRQQTPLDDLLSYYDNLNVVIAVAITVNVLDHRFPSPVLRVIHNFTRRPLSIGRLLIFIIQQLFFFGYAGKRP